MQVWAVHRPPGQPTLCFPALALSRVWLSLCCEQVHPHLAIISPDTWLPTLSLNGHVLVGSHEQGWPPCPLTYKLCFLLSLTQGHLELKALLTCTLGCPSLSVLWKGALSPRCPCSPHCHHTCSHPSPAITVSLCTQARAHLYSCLHPRDSRGSQSLVSLKILPVQTLLPQRLPA